jgi:predicted protein tyrosine phosphatase
MAGRSFTSKLSEFYHVTYFSVMFVGARVHEPKLKRDLKLYIGTHVCISLLVSDSYFFYCKLHVVEVALVIR